METLTALRALTTAGQPLTLVATGGTTTETLTAASTHLMLADAPVDLDTPLPVRTAKVPSLNLRALVCLWLTRDRRVGEYIVAASAARCVNVATQERKDLCEWLAGNTHHCALVGPATADRHGSDAGAFGLGSGENNAAGHDADDRMDLDDDLALPHHEDDSTDRASRVRAKEYELRSRTTYLTPAGNKNFTHVTKVAYDVFMGTGSRTAAAAASSRQAAPSSRSRRPGGKDGAGGTADPIIMVPPGFAARLNMYNVQDLLENASFVPAEDKRRENPRATKPTRIDLVRKQNTLSSSAFGNRKWRFTVMDSGDKLTTAADWDRVVAVFAGGMSWQFDGWKWPTPVELFSNVRGYIVKYHDEEVPPAVKLWNVKVLEVERSKRHKDLPMVLDFWSDLEKFIATHKPHLLPKADKA
ncbi:RNA pol II accessory factor, Cdc73 family-domain-containing protein [Blastocladiella britannica]|nr:RNA pol II accessory factor, Cdc73 family-domain-containing protein [Blastocladiella britannica]